MKGKIIIIEGTDASGKSTQLDLLCKKLEAEGKAFKTLSFPRYGKDSSALVRMYLGGQMGDSPDAVNAYAASAFFAVDRMASFKTEWGEFYNGGGILIFDRYTTSNAIHQSAKLAPTSREDFCHWLFDFEYHLMGLPAPDMVFFLDMPPEYSAKLLEERTGKAIDIHEKDAVYRSECYKCAKMCADLFSWERISCVEDGEIKSREAIHNEIFERLNTCLNLGK